MTPDSRTSKLSGAAVYGVVMTTPPSTDWQDSSTVERMLDELETWAVVGLSGDPGRTAYSIASLLQSRGKRIVPIHPVFADPGAPAVLGEQGYASLADVPFAVDVVDVFRRSEAAGEFADQAVAIGAKGVWFQLGVVDEDAFARTTAAGVPMVMDTCPAIEWRRRGR
jgi:predicted CoA-binding protein